MNPYKKHPFCIVAILFTGPSLLLIGCRRDTSAQEAEESKPTEPVQVRCATASVTTLRPFLEVVGTLVSIPEKTAVLSTQVAGQVQQLLVVEGQRVQAGDVLLQLDDRSAEAQRAKARAAVAESRAIVSRLKHGSRSEDIDVARQELRKSETNLRLMRGKVQSGTALQDVHAIPEQELAQRTADAEDAEADVAANQARLKLLEAGPRAEEISEAEAKLAGAEADLASSELALQLTRITAPLDGVLMDVPVRQGMFVSAGMTLMTLADLSTLFARTRVPTAYLSQVKEGQNVDVRVASFPDDTFTGAIARIRKQADVQTGDVDAFASAPNPDGSLRPGLACRLQIWLPEIRDAVAVPVTAIADRDGVPVVTVIRDEKAYETEVRLGALTNQLVQILGGVSPGDLVAVEGGYGLPDGCPCIVLDPQVTAASAME
jgi:multidrug efflux pump subunit AcrA (membrane-fusion protein)